MGRPVNKRYFSETFDAAAHVVGGSSAVAATINSQKGTKTFNVTTAQGTSDVTLVAAAIPTEGQMNITATDSAGGTYYVVKLFNQTAVLVQNDGTQFDDNAKVDWTALDSVNGGYSAISAGNEVENVSVSLVS